MAIVNELEWSMPSYYVIYLKISEKSNCKQSKHWNGHKHIQCDTNIGSVADNIDISSHSDITYT